MYQRGPSGRTCIAYYLLLWGTLWLRRLVLLAADPATWVNPFVGTRLSNLSDYGKTIPGAVRPFGMLNWGPDTAGVEFYQWEKPLTRGFSLTHTSGPECGQFGDAPVFPLEGTPIDTTEGPMTSSFQHEHEVAEPGYYSVVLDSGIHVQLAAQVRSGIAEFDFPSGAESHTLLLTWATILAHASTQPRSRSMGDRSPVPSPAETIVASAKINIEFSLPSRRNKRQ
jgi:putative alpha-1,2-mannosidase